MMIGSGTPSNHNSAPRPKPMTASYEFIRFILPPALSPAEFCRPLQNHQQDDETDRDAE
jgi:hypothetical protein